MKRQFEEAVPLLEIPNDILGLIFNLFSDGDRLRWTLVSKSCFSLLTPLIEGVAFSRSAWIPMGLEGVRERMPNLTTLSLRHCSYNDDELIGTLTGLKSLFLENTYNDHNYHRMRSISRLTNLETLRLSNMGVESDTIYGLTSLRSLSLDNTCINSSGLVLLTNLTELNLSKKERFRIHTQSVAVMAKLEKLTTGCDIHGNELKGLINLKEVNLHCNSYIKWETIWKLPKLERFTLYKCKKINYRCDKKGWEVKGNDNVFRGKKIYSKTWC